MKKLLAFLDNHALKYLLVATIAFVALYPKLPSVHIIRTWVYIRLEDFLISLVVTVFLVQVLRGKTRLALPIGIPIFIYWLVGMASLIFSLIFIGPHLLNFFPHLAILSYGRRIEYMILFFVAFSTIRSVNDVKHYIIALFATLIGVIAYGFGQNYYTQVWALFPKFFEKYPFCFPSFQTGNEEFAKGLPLCLPQGARITSTFGGHYDLAGYLVVVLPIILGVFFALRERIAKYSVAALYIASLSLLIFTASRISFFAYLIGVIATLLFLKKKKWLVPVLAISIILLLTFSQSTAKRFLETFRIVNLITNSQGKVVGVAATNLPDSLKNKIAKDTDVVVEAPPPMENLPSGSSFINLPQAAVATTEAIVKNQLSTRDALRLKLANGGLQLSTVSGSFLIQKALVYDISFTTRFQAEWPRAWSAFLANPPLGSGYATITLAADNDYLRLLGESGFLGLITFLLVFIAFGILVGEKIGKTDSLLVKGFVLGLSGGVLGLFVNATLIDVFEASKIAEPLWILLGIGAGALSLIPGKVQYVQKIWKTVSATPFIILYMLITIFVVFGKTLQDFFVGDDFTWLKWAATATPKDLAGYFVNAQGFFYRPLDKVVTYFLYTFFSLEPQGYHLFILSLHFLMSVGVFILARKVFGKRNWAVLSALLFVTLPILAENLNWFATVSIELSSVFLLWGVLSYISFREKKSVVSFIVTVILAILALFSYEMAVIFPLLLLSVDVFILKKKLSKQTLFAIGSFLILDCLYLYVRSSTHVVPVGGDYSYSIPHLIPNIFGNLLGYAGLVLFGERSLSFYESLRSALKELALPIGFALVLLIGGIVLKWGKRLLGIYKNTKLQPVLFAKSFIIIGLLPFIGLGNIAERYGYFAGVGFALLATILLKYLWEFLAKKLTYKKAVALFSLLLCGIFLWNWSSLTREQTQWAKAGDITQETLGLFTFDFNYGKIPEKSHIYFANVPIKYGNAWIFPVGLADGMWFIYKDQNMNIIQVPTVADGQNSIQANPAIAPAQDYLFVFDKNGDLTEVK